MSEHLDPDHLAAADRDRHEARPPEEPMRGIWLAALLTLPVWIALIGLVARVG